MKKIPASEPYISNEKTANSAISPSHYLDHDTEEEVSTIHYCQDCFVLFDDMLEKKQIFFILFSHADNIKTTMCNIYQDGILS